MITDEERGAIGPAEELAVRRAVTIIVGADVVYLLVTVGSWGDVAEKEILGPARGGDAEGEGAGRVTVDPVGAAPGFTGDGAGGSWARGRGCDAEDGGEAEEDGG